MSRRPSPLERFDLRVAHAAARTRDSLAVRAGGWLSEAADQPQLYTLCGAVLSFGLLTGRRRLARAGVRMLAAEWLATKAKAAVKARVDRTRPHVAIDEGEYRMERGDSGDKPLTSFPSGHTAGAVAVARAWASEYPEAALPAYLAASAIALVQVPRAKHYLSDIAVGAAIGLVAGGLVARAE